MRATKEVMGFDPDAHFVVPDAVREHMNGAARGQSARASGRTTFDAWAEAFPELARARGTTAWAARGRREALPEFPAGEEVATRDAGRKVMQAFKDAVPTMVGGSADLVESTKTEFEGAGVFSAQWIGPQHRLRDPRARDGLDRQRDRACTADASRRTARRS